MKGIDTNILLRYLLRDDEEQYQKALSLFKGIGNDQFFVNLVVVTEVWWVLDYIYNYKKEELISTFEILLQSKEIVFQEAESIFKALNTYKKSNADFEDCLINQLNENIHAAVTYTFDKKASRLKGMNLLE
ncbi:PIN domain-containing protein [Gracilimonas mengyeensis]|uniref:Predicted nucleic-acid-binding protein, contains PIN domain n=1 Tax=Gracilimonas mengyeensis TaxID=1302730 RepID=A0A521CDQ8_9BACT|nr:type II toxin-antitoxin system VapC family toxin [Gracilimonas mengyeensis]SMO57567.1 Predicted nucleic-acid-binding protein, contains PIN domain [Gracilimonas mengyeensis]